MGQRLAALGNRGPAASAASGSLSKVQFGFLQEQLNHLSHAHWGLEREVPV